jgi:hypothetical protein
MIYCVTIYSPLLLFLPRFCTRPKAPPLSTSARFISFHFISFHFISSNFISFLRASFFLGLTSRSSSYPLVIFPPTASVQRPINQAVKQLCLSFRDHVGKSTITHSSFRLHSHVRDHDHFFAVISEPHDHDHRYHHHHHHHRGRHHHPPNPCHSRTGDNDTKSRPAPASAGVLDGSTLMN